MAFPAGNNSGDRRFNGAAGSIAKDSVFNALAVYRAVIGKNAAL